MHLSTTTVAVNVYIITSHYPVILCTINVLACCMQFEYTVYTVNSLDNTSELLIYTNLHLKNSNNGTLTIPARATSACILE